MNKKNRKHFRTLTAIRRKVKMSPDIQQAMKVQLQLFKDTFGRDPGPGDPVFFDHQNTEVPTFMSPQRALEEQKELGNDMRMAGVRPAIAYAVGKTGMILTEMNQHMFQAQDLAEWDAAIAEYHKLHPLLPS